MKKANIVMVTGGTGGHIYPAITLANALKAQNHTVTFIGNRHKMEAHIVPAAGFEFVGIKNRGLVGNPLQKLWILISQIKPTLQSIGILKQLKAERVIGFGGYVSIPVGLAAAWLKIPMYLHEQNAIAGLANTILQRFAKRVAVSYPESVSQFNPSKTVFIGNPRGGKVPTTMDKTAYFDSINLNPDRFTFLIVMGSQGSETINAILKASVSEFESKAYQAILVVGDQHYEAFKTGVKAPANVVVLSHVDQRALLVHVDAIMCRAGATTISEVIAANIPAAFIPSPYVVKNHQFKNIEPLLDAKAALYIKEQDFSMTSLFQTLDLLYEDKSLYGQIKTNMKPFQTPHVMEDFIELLDIDGK